MGVFSGLITFGVALWFLQTVSNINETAAVENKKNGWKWFWIGAGTYFGGFLIGYILNRMFVLSIGGIDIGIGEGLSEASGGDTGAMAIILELAPIALGLVLAYVIRRRWLLNKKFDWSALISRFSTKS